MADTPSDQHADTGRMECTTCGKVKQPWEAWSTGQCDACYLRENAPELLPEGDQSDGQVSDGD